MDFTFEMMITYHHHHHKHHKHHTRLFLWTTYFMSYIVIVIVRTNLTTATSIATTTAMTTIHLDSNIDNSIDNNKDDVRRRVNTISTSKYQKTMKHSIESVGLGLTNPKQQGLRKPKLDHINPSTVDHHTITAAAAVTVVATGSSSQRASAINQQHPLDHKTSSSSTSHHHHNHNNNHNHDHHHNHNRNEISNITICPHTYPFPAMEGALLSNSMKGPGYCSSIESGYKVNTAASASYYIGVSCMIHAYNW